MTILSRRALLLSGAALLASSSHRGNAAPTSSRTPVRGEYLIRARVVLTMDNALGDIADGMVHVKNGAIVAVGRDLKAPGAKRIDAPNCILMPGLVDTHWHMWNSMERALASIGDKPFFQAALALAPHFTPEDNYIGTKLALAEAANSGITTVHNWAHNTRSYETAAAEIRAHRESGLRGRFAYGYPQELAKDKLMDTDGLARCRRDLFDSVRDSLLSLGIAVRGPERSDESIWRREWAVAKEMGLPLTTHIATTPETAKMGAIATLAKDNLLGPKVQLVHATHATTDDFQLIAASGSPVSISPWTEMRVGYGIPPLVAMVQAGVPISLSVDNLPLAGNADLFSVMRVTAALASGEAQKQDIVTPRRVLEWATIGGAKDLGLSDITGSLTPGKRADLILVRLDDLNTTPAPDIASLLTYAVQPANVDFVMSDGRIFKEKGVLHTVDKAALLRQVMESLTRIRKRAGV